MLHELCLLKILYICSIPSECSGRIINGVIAGLDDLRYTISIRIRKYDDSWGFGQGHNCGGSLIKRDVVLSAAHCFVNFEMHDGSLHPPNLYNVVMGCSNLYRKENDTIIFDIEEVITYRKWFNFIDGDIALVFLRGCVPSDHPIIQPISINRKEMPVNTMCYVNGWGETEKLRHLKRLQSADLRRVDVPLIDCATQTNYSKKRLGIGVLCTGDLKGQFGPCHGDSGGPLVCKKRLTGIVSYGESCDFPLPPAVYTDVAFYSSWIDKHLNTQRKERIIGNNTTRLEDHFVTIVFLILNVAFKTHAVLFRKLILHIFTF